MKFEEFIKEIWEYESDTFSASKTKLTKEEAEEIAENILFELTEAYNDGGRISQNLLDLRGVEEEGDLYKQPSKNKCSRCGKNNLDDEEASLCETCDDEMGKEEEEYNKDFRGDGKLIK